MVWWMWVVAGLVLLVLEIATPGLFFLFFGAAAVLVGLLDLAIPESPLWVELLVFAILSIVSLLVFRGPLARRLRSRTSSESEKDPIVGEMGTASESIAVGEVGKVELRGTSWNARNIGSIDLSVGTRFRVDGLDGLTLHVRADADA